MESQTFEQASGKEKEKIIIQIERDEAAFTSFASFMQKLRSKYLSDDFPDEETVNRINPSNEDSPGINMIAYSALLNNETVGIIVGEDQADTLKGDWYVIDPEYQNSEVKKSLIEAVRNDYRRITLLASIQDKSPVKKDDPDYFEKTIKWKTSRQQALIRYYKRLGFKPNVHSELYEHSSREPYYPMPMVIEEEN